ncbi:MAG: adenylate cyclase [Paracoccaceae bacterium]|jgi:adenylate cyclase
MNEAFLKSEIQEQLTRILQDEDFPATQPRRDFIKYVIDETLEGRENLIKGVSIAFSVFGRDVDFDQQTDPIVRLEARRLRSDLDSYYAGNGRNDAIRISIPKGGYIPKFIYQEGLYSPDIPEEAARSPAPRLGSKRTRLFAALAAFFLLALPVLWYELGRAVTVQADVPKGPVIAVLPFEY